MSDYPLPQPQADRPNASFGFTSETLINEPKRIYVVIKPPNVYDDGFEVLRAFTNIAKAQRCAADFNESYYKPDSRGEPYEAKPIDLIE